MQGSQSKIAECLILPARMKSPEVPVKKHELVLAKRAATRITIADQKGRGRQPILRLVGRNLDNGVMREGTAGVTPNLVGGERRIRPDIKVSTNNCNTNEGLPDEKKSKPALFLPTSNRAAEDWAWLSKVIGVVYPGHGNPSVPNMIGGLRAILATFARFDWKFHNLGKYYLVRFPSAKGLDHAVGRTSIPCRDHTGGFTVYRWSGGGR